MSDPNQNPPAPPAEKLKKARVLVDCDIGGERYRANDVASVDDATLKARPNELDATPAAVKYAESLKSGAES